MFGGGSQSSSSTSRSLETPTLIPLRQDLSQIFRNMLGSTSLSDLGSNPQGIIGSIFQNLFGDSSTADQRGSQQWIQGTLGGSQGTDLGLVGADRGRTGNLPSSNYGQPWGPFPNPMGSASNGRSTGDFLGARQALTESLSGQGLDRSLQLAQQQLLPSTLSNIQLGSAALRNAAGPLGLRFSTDLMGQQRNFANQQFMGMQQNALQTALPMWQQRGQLAGDIYSLIGQLGNAQLARQLPLLIQYATGFAPTGSNSSGSGWNFNVL